MELRSWLAIASKIGRRGSVEIILLVVQGRVNLEAIGLEYMDLGREKAFLVKIEETFREQNIAEGREEGARGRLTGNIKAYFPMHGGVLGVQIFGRIIMQGRRRSAEQKCHYLSGIASADTS